MNKLQKTYYKYRLKIIAAASLMLLVLAVVNVYFYFEVAVVSNDECLWIPQNANTDSTIIIFDKVKVNGVAWNAGIRNGDQLLKINNVIVKNTKIAQKELNKFKKGELADYTVLKNGKILKTKVYVKKLINFPGFAASIFGLIWLIIGYIVFTAKPEGRIQKIFFALGASFVLSASSVILQHLSLTSLSFSKWLLPTISFFWALGFSFLPFLILYFFWMFPKPFKFAQKKSLRHTLILLSVFTFIGLYSCTLLSFGFNKIAEKYFLLCVGFLRITVLIAYLIGWISLIINYKTIKDPKEKRPTLLILIAVWVSIAAGIYTVTIAPAISDTIYNSPEYYMPIILIILVPLTFSYSIFKYQLMDVSVVIKNTITYGVATISLAGIYFFVIYIIGQGISQAIGTEYQGLIAGIFFVVFAIVFQSTKDKFQDFITSKFYPEQFAHQKVLIKFISDVTTLVGLNNIISALAETFVKGMKISRFGVMIKQDASDVFNLLQSTGIINKNLIMVNSQIIKRIKLKSIMSQPLVIEEEEFEAVFPEQCSILKEDGIHTIVPMIIKSEVIGLLLFGLKHSGAKFAGKDLELLCATANQAAIAIENARLYIAESEKLKMEKELDLARNIQQGLLPKEIPQITGLDIAGKMIAAMKVGGDYYDLLSVENDKLYVVVGDVSGKGLSASLYMTKIQTMIQFACNSIRSPSNILKEVNQKIYGVMERRSFVTMSVAKFDMNKKQISYCRAGHLPMVHISDGKVRNYRTEGIGLGLEKGPIFNKTLKEEKIKIEDGDLFAFVSDGVTEALNKNGELFGEERLTEQLLLNSHLPSNRIIERILKSIDNFRNGCEVNDDITLVVVKAN